MSATKSLYPMLFDSANIGILVLDKDTKIIDCNHIACKMLGVSQNEIIGKKPQDPEFSPEYQPKGELSSELAKKHITQVVNGEEIIFTWTHLRNDRTELPVEVSFFGFETNNTKNYFSIWKDLTLVKKKEQKLIESEERFRTIYTKANDGIILHPLDLSKGIEDCNEAALNMLGYNSKKDLIGKTIFEISAPLQQNGIPSKDLAKKKLEECVETGQSHFEWLYLHQNNSPIHIDVVLTLIKLNNEMFIHSIWRDISEKKKYEEALIKTEKLLNESQLIAGMGSWELDINTDQLYCSDSFFRLLGIIKTNNTITLEEYLEYVFPDDREFVKQQIREVIERRENKNNEHRIVRADGQIRCMTVYSGLVNPNQEAGQKLIGIVQDITERKNVEGELKKKNKEYYELNNTLEQSIEKIKQVNKDLEQAKKDAEEKELFLNQTQEAGKIGSYKLSYSSGYFITSSITDKIFGLSDSFEKTIDNWYKIICTEKREKMKSYFKNEARETKESFSLEYPITRPFDKKIRWIYSVCKNIFDVHGNAVSMIGIVQDITERKEYEEKLIINEKRLSNSQRIAKLGCWELKLRKNILFWNNELLEIFGYKDETITATFESFLELTHPEDRDMVINHYEELLRTKKFEDFECRIIRPDGLKRIILVAGEVLLDEKGKPTRTFGVVQDITERKQYEQNILKKNEEYQSLNEELWRKNEELLQAKEIAENANNLKTEFLNNISHEVRTPLNGIVGFSELMGNPNISTEKRQYYSTIVQNSSYQLLHIIDDVLEISNLETKQLKIKSETFCLNELLRVLFSIYNLQLRERNIHFSISLALDDEHSNIISDKAKLNRILGNLLENSIKFTFKGFIEMGYYVKDQNLILYVKDSGIGISLENQKTIFERFSQEEKHISRKYGGLGLGLSISEENVKLLGGKITLESKKHKGSTFYVTIPFKPASNKTVKKHPPAESINKNKTTVILIAEDEEINYLYLKTLFDEEFKSKYKLLHAWNGKEVIDICNKTKNIDIVLMDIKMPVMNGLEATKEIKRIFPDIPVIAQTAYSTESDRILALNYGCDDFLSKPIKKERLLELIEKYASKINDNTKIE